MTYCDEHEGGCGASLTETDFEAGYCTQCKRQLSTKETRTMNKSKGHSNARTDETEPWPGDTEKAIIPISGGQTVASWRPLPPLTLTREGWREIGERMGWLSEVEAALKDICARPTLGRVRPAGINRVRNYTFTPDQLQRARSALGLE